MNATETVRLALAGAGGAEDLLLNRGTLAQWAPVALLAALGFAVFLYWSQAPLGRIGRVLLGALRLAALALLVLILLEPRAVVREEVAVKPRLLILVDASESMGLRDVRKRDEELAEAALALSQLPWEASPAQQAAFLEKERKRLSQVSRAELAAGLAGSLARELAPNRGVEAETRFCRFGDGVELVGSEAAPPGAEALKPSAKTTRLGSALLDAAQLYGGDRLAGMVVVTDGASNAGADPLEAARRLAQRGVPVHVLGVGLPAPDDVSVAAVIVQEAAFAGDTVPLRVRIDSTGFEKRETTLTLRVDGESVAQQPVVLTGEPQFEELSFDVPRDKRGAMRLEAALSPLPGEATEANNRVERTLRVVDQKVKVLCIEGAPRWEYRYLRAILLREPRLDVRFIAAEADPELPRASREYLAAFPERQEDAFLYDLVILGDVRPSFFKDEDLQRIEELVRERGGSFLMLAGPRFAPSGYADTPIARLLPVKFEAGPPEDVEKDTHPVVTAEGRRSMVMTLALPEERNDAVWSRVKPLTSLPPLSGVKPGATVLAELSDTGRRLARYPLVAWQRYGAGKTFFLGSDRLWRLRFKTGDKYHWRLWSQTIQFLTLSRLLGEHQRVRLETDRARYAAGENVRLFAHVFSEAYEPALEPSYRVFVSAQDGAGALARPVQLRPAPARPGLYEGCLTAGEPGRYAVRADQEDLAAAHEAAFEVGKPDRELAVTAARLEDLREIARLSGGRFLSARDIPRASELLASGKTFVSRRRELTLWDTWWAGVLFLALVGSEWFFRRWNSLR